MPVQIIENWLTNKQNEKASRLFDDKELQLKFKEYKPKEDRYHKYDKEKMIVKMSIDSKKIIIGEYTIWIFEWWAVSSFELN